MLEVHKGGGERWFTKSNLVTSWHPYYYTGQLKLTFFQNALENFIYSGAEWCLKPDVAFSFSLN